jgi:hypothetical protein
MSASDRARRLLEESPPTAHEYLSARIVFLETEHVAQELGRLAARNGSTIAGELRRALRGHMAREGVSL